MKKLIAGNWKMNGFGNDAAVLAKSVVKKASGINHVDWLVCPPFIHLNRVFDIVDGTSIGLGAQDCSQYGQGAKTGDISADMVRDSGCRYCIVGHSERRADYKESDALVKAKAEKIVEQGMIAIICVGETLEDRDSGDAFAVVEKQIRSSLPENANAGNSVIAYEPVWAIGTGKAAMPQEVSDMHDGIRKLFESTLATGTEMRIIYGGSVNPGNAVKLINLPNVDGALVGGASLKVDDFIAIGQAAKR